MGMKFTPKVMPSSSPTSKSEDSVPDRKKLKKRGVISRRGSSTTALDVATVINLAQKSVTTHSIFVISLNNRFRMAWDGVVAVSLAYIFMMVPLELSFGEPSSFGWQWLGKIVDLIFWTDIFMCFATTYMDKESGTEVYDQKKVAINYIKDFFFIDIFCSVPGYPLSAIIMNLLGQNGSSASSFVKMGKAPRVLKVVRGAKLLKMLRYMKIQRMMEDIQVAYPEMNVVIKLGTVLVTYAVFLHMNACAFSLVAAETRYASSQGSWLDQTRGGVDWTEDYLNAMYWAATTSTTVGYGDISPQNNSEKIFCIFSMCFGVGIYGYVIGIMTNLATDVSHAQKSLLAKMNKVGDLSALHHFPRELKLSLSSYFRNYYRDTRTLNRGEQHHIFEAMPYALLLQCRTCILGRHLVQINFFKSVSPKYFPILVELLLPITEYGRILIAKQHPHQNFFVLLSGLVAIQQPREKAEDFDFRGVNVGNSKDAEAVQRCSKAVEFMYMNHSKDEGHMDVSGLHEMLNKMAREVSVGEEEAVTLRKAKEIFLTIDIDKSGTVELDEFASWYLAEELKLSSSRFSRFGNIKAKLTPVCIFGTWSAFDYGPSKYNYVCEVESELYSIDADRFKQTFDHTIVKDLIDRDFIEPLRKHGADLDIKEAEQKERRRKRPRFRSIVPKGAHASNTGSQKSSQKSSSQGSSVAKRIWTNLFSVQKSVDVPCIEGTKNNLSAQNSSPDQGRSHGHLRTRFSAHRLSKLLERESQLDLPEESLPGSERVLTSDIFDEKKIQADMVGEDSIIMDNAAAGPTRLAARTGAGPLCSNTEAVFSGPKSVSKSESVSKIESDRAQVRLLKRLVQESVQESEARILEHVTSKFNVLMRQLQRR